METSGQALPVAAWPAGRRARGGEVLLVVGAGGVLGAALLARALGSGRFARVQALVAQPLSSTLQGFEPLPAARLDGALQAQTAVIVFERARRNNGRDEAFVQPAPAELPEFAQRLFTGGVRRLVVVVPHAPALLPQALMSGLASLDEGRVAAMGFEQLLFMRAAQFAAAASPLRAPVTSGEVTRRRQPDGDNRPCPPPCSTTPSCAPACANPPTTPPCG